MFAFFYGMEEQEASSQDDDISTYKVNFTCRGFEAYDLQSDMRQCLRRIIKLTN